MLESKKDRFTVGIVGSGKVGAVLGAALMQAGHNVVGVSAISEASVDRAELFLPGVPILSIPEVLSCAEIVFFTVPDDVLSSLVRGLVVTGSFNSGQIVVHTSGRFGIRVLDPILALGGIPMALHPSMSFTGTKVDLERLAAGCCFGVTATDSVLPIAQALVLELGGNPIFVAEENRAAYHTALSHAANNLVTLVGQSSQILSDIGIEDSRELLSPLLYAALDNVLRLGEKSLSGPVSRGDVETVKSHVAFLSQSCDSYNVLDSYRVLARSTAMRALERGMLSLVEVERLLAVLSDESFEN